MVIRKIFISLLVSLVSLPLMLKAQDTGELNDSTLSSSMEESFSLPPDSLAEFYEYAAEDPVTRLAVVLSDIYSKKDMEFTRGLLMGMSHSGLPDNSISLKIVNGEIPEDSLQYELELFGPHVIISTFEKEAPNALRTYTQENGSRLLNVFDAKGDDYIYNPGIFQLLAPSDKFNASLTRYILEGFGGNTMILLGEPDLSDPVVLELVRSWPEEEMMIVSQSDLEVFEFEGDTNYFIYPLFSSNDEVKEAMGRIINLMAKTPSAGVKVFGRPNWVAFNNLSNMIANMEVYIPAKCYFDPSSDSGKRFIGAYNTMFGHAPIRSYPVYAVMGYDTARYFLPRLNDDIRNVACDWEPENMLQSYFNMRKSEGGGYYNSGGYILHYEPWGTMVKETVGE